MDKIENQHSLSTISINTNESVINQDRKTIRKKFKINSIQRAKLLSDYSNYINNNINSMPHVTEEVSKEEDIIENEASDIGIQAIHTNNCKNYNEYFNNDNTIIYTNNSNVNTIQVNTQQIILNNLGKYLIS